jgi:hypothetical protein
LPRGVVKADRNQDWRQVPYLAESARVAEVVVR